MKDEKETRVETLIEEEREALEASENSEEEREAPAAPEIPAGYVSEEEARKAAEEAYLRGRNEAVEAKMAEDTIPAGPEEDDGIGYVFHPRRSVWETDAAGTR